VTKAQVIVWIGEMCAMLGEIKDREVLGSVPTAQSVLFPLHWRRPRADVSRAGLPTGPVLPRR